ncbi:MAG: hypothetical protein JXA68_04175, partial [Ignavibacteriales bacterium]|nr:hypothetical protein [Ignavibacteriales bacterium]
MKLSKLFLSLLSLLVFTSQIFSQKIEVDKNKFSIFYNVEKRNFIDEKPDDITIRDYYEFTNPDEAGKLKLPMINLIVAIPPNTKPNILVIPITQRKLNKIIPSINPSIESELNIDYKVKPINYDYEKIFGFNLFEIEKYFWYRDFYCISLKIYTAEYLISENSLVEYDKFKIEFSFDENIMLLENSPIELLSNFDNLLSRIIINNTIAEQFRTNDYQIFSDTTGNWINYDKMYLKLAIIKDDVYRINKSKLDSLGVQILDPKKIQLFESGVEIPIYVFGEEDGNFDEGDYIEFYGHKNYSGLEYRVINNSNSTDIPYMNRYTDTSYYFLTWDNVDGKRINIQDLYKSEITDELNYYTKFLHVENDKKFMTVASDFLNQDPCWLKTDLWAWGTLNECDSLKSEFWVDGGTLSDKTAAIHLKVVSVSVTAGSHHLSLYVNNSKLDQRRAYTNDRILMGGTFSSNLFNKGAINYLRIFNEDNDTVNANPSLEDINQVAYDWYEVELPVNLSAINDSLTFQFNHDISPGEKKIKISNISSNDLIIYKVSPRLKKTTTFSLVGTNLYFTDTVNIGDKYILIPSNSTQKPLIKSIRNFTNLRNSNNNGEYIIITNRLFNSAFDYGSFISDSYKSNFSNDNITTKVVFVNDIFDEFSWGYPYPESIKEFLKIAFQNWSSPKPAYLLLMGSASWDYKNIFSNPINKNFVPTFGHPVSDTWFTMWSDTGKILPQMFVGRLPVSDNQEIYSYINKHKNYLNQDIDFFNKRFLLFSGGLNDYERVLMKNQNEVVRSYAEQRPLGLKSTHFYNTGKLGEALGPYTTDFIDKEIGLGGVVISYLGHSAMNTWDNGITDIKMLDNLSGKSSFITDFGCATNKFAEPNAKAFSVIGVIDGQLLGYIANSSLGFSTTSYNSPIYFYNSMFIDSTYSIGACHLELKNKIYTYLGLNTVTKLFAETNLLVGDPILSIVFSRYPNLNIVEEKVWSSIDFPTDFNEFCPISIVYNNFGLAPSDSFSLKISTVYKDQQNEYIINKILPTFEDTIIFNLPIKKMPGLHSINIDLDYQNKINEGDNEQDNFVTFSIYVTSVAVRPLIYERLYSKIKDTITYLNPNISQNSNNTIIIEIDTNENFSNPNVFTKEIDTFKTIIDLNDYHLIQDNRYWIRGRLSTEEIYWGTTFSFIKGNDNLKYLIKDSTSRSDLESENLIYQNNSYSLAVNDTFVLKVESAKWGGYGNILLNDVSMLPSTWSSGMGVAIFDSATMSLDTSYTYYFWNQPDAPNQLAYLINSTTSDQIVALCVMENGAKNITDSLKTAIRSLGSTKIDSLREWVPWLLIGRKGASGNEVIEKIKFTGVNEPFILEGMKTYIRTKSSGYLLTNTIGPVSQWDFIKADYDLSNDSKIEVIPLGIKSDNSFDTLNTILLSDSLIELENKITKEYHYYRFLINFVLSSLGDSPKLSSIGLNFMGIPELGVNYQVVDLSPDTVTQGEDINIKFGVYNVGESTALNFNVATEIINMQTNTVEQVFSEFVDSLSSKDRKKFEINYNTVNTNGYKKFRIRIDSSNFVPELYEDNNIFEVPFYIKRDTTKPDILVTFDGSDILEGDFVSPEVEIYIELNEPSLIPINDPNSVAIYLDEIRINYSTDSDSLSYTFSEQNPKVKVNYKPNL